MIRLTIAAAGIGLPMLMWQMPLMFIAIIPIIIVEWGLVRRRFDLTTEGCLGAVTTANLVSTVVGAPLSWIMMLAIEFSTTGGRAYGLATSLDRRLAVTLQAARLVPYEGEMLWMVPAASLVLLVPSFLPALSLTTTPT